MKEYFKKDFVGEELSEHRLNRIWEEAQKELAIWAINYLILRCECVGNKCKYCKVQKELQKQFEWKLEGEMK